MRIPRHWATVEADLHINGQVQPSCFTGSSDLSEADARDAAWDQRALVQARIDANDGKRAEDYEVAIREEIVKELARDAIVTRNRYGAEVLNCARLVMIDVDHAPGPGFWTSLFGGDTRSPKQRMLDRIREVANKHRDRSLSFRIYETHRGYRVLVTGRQHAPTDPLVQRWFKAMNCDALYAKLCVRQDCYRARLTPKPSRIRLKAIRLRFPYEREMQEVLATWLPDYADRSQRYTVCHLIEVIGDGFVDEVVRYHDERCCRGRDLPLA
jgi:hypothetical protein